MPLLLADVFGLTALPELLQLQGCATWAPGKWLRGLTFRNAGGNDWVGFVSGGYSVLHLLVRIQNIADCQKQHVELLPTS
jgi:hypothetical protein